MRNDIPTVQVDHNQPSRQPRPQESSKTTISDSMSRNSSIPSTPSGSITRTYSGRTPLFTPKRPSSAQSNSSSTSTSGVIQTPTSTTAANADALTARLNRVNQPVLLNSTHRKYKAPLSVESRKVNNTSPFKPKMGGVGLAPIPGTPTANRTPTKSKSTSGSVSRDGSPSRPRTPGTPRSKSRGGAESPSLMRATSEMDVSNVDPEDVLVDAGMVEPGDISVEMDDVWLKGTEEGGGAEDKVMVSVRIRPTDSKSAWIPNTATNSLKLDPANMRGATTTSTTNSSFNFDAVLTGTPNKPIYTTVARSHVQAAMEGYNAVIFAYGQTASGKTFTLTGDDDEPGIIPRAMRDVFGCIKRTPEREYLLRCSYLEIYNESIIDLLAPPMSAKANPVQIQGGAGGEVVLAPLREEVVTSLKGVKEVLKRGEGNRRTACTDWNERSSRSHSVFRLVVESRERAEEDVPVNGRQTPGLGGRHTPGPGGPRLQVKGGKSVQTSVLSLIDLAGSEKATSDKERTREGKYINTSLLTLGTVIGTLADNANKAKPDHVPYRNSKLTRLLQPSLSGNARISVICTINPDASAVGESTSTLLFARRIKNVHLNAKKKEVVDTDALIERYRKEIEELKARLAEREADAPVRNRRLSAREQIDESKAMKDLNSRIHQLTSLILTSASVDENSSRAGEDGESRPASPVKIDFDMSPYQLQQELLAARLQIDTQATQILSLEASLLSRPPIPSSASQDEKDTLIASQAKTIRELEIVVRGYEDTLLGEPLRKVKEDVEREWGDKLEEEKKKREEGERWAQEVVRALEKEKKARVKLEEERRALAAFVTKFDALGLGAEVAGAAVVGASKVKPPMPTPGGALTAYERRTSRSFSSNLGRLPRISDVTAIPDLDHHLEEELGAVDNMTGHSLNLSLVDDDDEFGSNFSSNAAFNSSPMRPSTNTNANGNALSPTKNQNKYAYHPSLFDQAMPEGVEVDMSFDELEVEAQLLAMEGDKSVCVPALSAQKVFGAEKGLEKSMGMKPREVFGDKENILPGRV